jgi:hypothetical protein
MFTVVRGLDYCGLITVRIRSCLARFPGALLPLARQGRNGDTQAVSTSPQDPRTADYVAGRFG